MSGEWYVYIVNCRDNTLYTGMTAALAKRLQAHNSGKGAKYTRGRRPVRLVYYEPCDSRGEALRRESQLKRLKRDEKVKLVERFPSARLRKEVRLHGQ